MKSADVTAIGWSPTSYPVQVLNGFTILSTADEALAAPEPVNTVPSVATTATNACVHVRLLMRVLIVCSLGPAVPVRATVSDAG